MGAGCGDARGLLREKRLPEPQRVALQQDLERIDAVLDGIGGSAAADEGEERPELHDGVRSAREARPARRGGPAPCPAALRRSAPTSTPVLPPRSSPRSRRAPAHAEPGSITAEPPPAPQQFKTGLDCQDINAGSPIGLAAIIRSLSRGVWRTTPHLAQPRPDHAAYLASWLKVLKSNTSAIFTAASKAQAAVDWMHARQPQPMAIAA